jgi:hypothetical protein
MLKYAYKLTIMKTKMTTNILIVGKYGAILPLIYPINDGIV